MNVAQRVAAWVHRNPVLVGVPGLAVVLLGGVLLFGGSLIATGFLAVGAAVPLFILYVMWDARHLPKQIAEKRHLGEVKSVYVPPVPAMPARVVAPIVSVPVAHPALPIAPVLVPPPPPTEEANEPQSAPTWQELRAANVIGNGSPYIGFDLERYCDLRLRWKEELGSMFIVGMSGAGKTSAAVVLAVQTALDGGRLLVGDPHAKEEEQSLAGRVGALKRAFMMPVGVSDDEILELAQRAAEIAKRRLDGDRDRSPIFLMIDEWTALLRGPRGKALEDALFTVGLEGRKVNVNAALFAQLSTIEMAGKVRSVATTTFAFRTRPDQARYAIGEKVNVDIRRYADGQCYLMARRESFPSVQIPWISREDMLAVGAELGTSLMSTSAEGRSALPDLRLVTSGRGVVKWAEVARSALPEVLEAYFEREWSSGQIAKHILGVQGQGQELMDARAAVDLVIRENARPTWTGKGEEDA